MLGCLFKKASGDSIKVNENSITCVFVEERSYLSALLYRGEKHIGDVRLSYSLGRKFVMITRWFIDKEYQNGGYGSKLLYATLLQYINLHGIPSEISYTWNGENEYVLSFIERKFGAVCSCPLSVLKECWEDVQEAHIYSLSVEMVIKRVQESNVCLVPLLENGKPTNAYTIDKE